MLKDLNSLPDSLYTTCSVSLTEGHWDIIMRVEWAQLDPFTTGFAGHIDNGRTVMFLQNALRLFSFIFNQYHGLNLFKKLSISLIIIRIMLDKVSAKALVRKYRYYF